MTGNQDEKDYQDYVAYQQYLQSTKSQQPPQQLPDPADKAAQGMKQDAKPVSLMTNHFPASYTPGGTPAQASLDNPEATKGFARAGIGLAMAPLAGAEAAGAGIASRTAINAGGAGLSQYLGNLATGDEATKGVPAATAVGGVASLGADALGGIFGGLKRMYQTGKWAANPAGMQDTAMGAISDATDKLRSSEAENVAQGLAGKSVPVETPTLKGIHPEADSILGKYADPYGQIPSEVDMAATDANKIRKIVDSQISYKKLGPHAQTAEVAERDLQLKSLADKLRGQVHGVSPEVSDTFDQWSDNLNAARNLDKRAETAPMTVLTSPSIDRRALLQKVDEQVGSNLQDLGHQINDAKNLSNAAHQVQPVKAAMTLGKAGLTGLFKGAKQGNALSNPEVLQSLFGITSGGQ